MMMIVLNLKTVIVGCLIPTLRDHPCLPSFVNGSMLLICSVFMFSVLCLYILGSVLWFPLRFPHKKMFRVSLPQVDCRRAINYVICVCLHCVVLLFCLSSSCVPSVSGFSGFPIFHCLFGIL